VPSTRPPAPSIAALRRRLAAGLPGALRQAGVPGLSLALVDREGVLWAQGFGQARRGGPRKGLPATADSVYRVGSVSKLVTVAVVLDLVHEGRVDLDAPLTAYLPGFAMRSRFREAGAPTVRHLTTHHAGLPANRIKGMYGNGATAEALLPALAEELVTSPPGTLMAYSNLGASLLALVVEAVTGEPFARRARSVLFEPLGMTSSAFVPRARTADRLATGYRRGRPEPPPLLRDVAAAGLMASAVDLGRFARMVLRGGELDGRRVLPAALVAESLAAQNADVPLDLDQRVGLGWQLTGLSVRGGGVVAYHNGQVAGCYSQLALLPERGLGAVVLANAAHAQPLVDETVGELLEGALGTAQPPSAQSDGAHVPAPGRAQGQDAAELVGRYVTAAGILQVEAAGGRLRLRAGRGRFRLVPAEQGGYSVRPLYLGLFSAGGSPFADTTFTLARVAGRDLLVALRDGQRLPFGEKVAPTELSPLWRGRLGRYRVDNPDPGCPMKGLRLVVRDGLLCLRYRLPRLLDEPVVTPLRPLDARQAITLGLGRGRGETLRFEPGADGEVLVFSGYRARRR
jgi:CubicO group peptidase (beta-lactamase class C family)